MARALHGEVTLAGEKHRVVAFQRGTVDSVSATSLQVKSPDGFTATYVLSDRTRLRKQGPRPRSTTSPSATMSGSSRRRTARR